jgi:nicotinate-nucleotide pyrophosphorylase (carboxylating)
MIVKEKGVLAGTGIAEQIFYFIDSNLQVKSLISDGTMVETGTVVMTVSGKARSILMAERLALNCVQRMCGIATLTRKVVDQVVGLNTKIIDTRKTTPGIRFLEKLAVQIGGGENHRFGLYDMMMIKDNHIDYAGGIEEAITMADEYRKNQGLGIKLEIEARNLEEVDEILRVGLIDRIMLDNFSFEDMRTAVAKIPGSIETEASGGITIDNVRQYAECGVDFVSMGALTHSVSSLDISLKAY